MSISLLPLTVFSVKHTGRIIVNVIVLTLHIILLGQLYPKKVKLSRVLNYGLLEHTFIAFKKKEKKTIIKLKITKIIKK